MRPLTQCRRTSCCAPLGEHARRASGNAGRDQLDDPQDMFSSKRERGLDADLSKEVTALVCLNCTYPVPIALHTLAYSGILT